MRTESKRIWSSFEERRLDGLRYFVGGSGPPIVLVHGLGGMASNWRLVAPELAAERRVIVPDLPGHGGSAPLADAQSIDPYADAVLAVAEAEDAVPAPWVGHSLGGLVGLRAALRRPDAVTGLVLAAGAGISSATRIGRGDGHAARRRAARAAASAGGARSVSRSQLGRKLAFGWWGVADPAGLRPRDGGGLPRSGRRSTPTRVSAGRALVASDPRSDLDRVRCPCLCLWGARDNWVPLKDGMEYARRLRAPLRTIADCGHLLIGERPDAVVRAVREFVASLDAG